LLHKVTQNWFIAEVIGLEQLSTMGGHPKMVKNHGVIVERSRAKGLVLRKLRRRFAERSKEASAAGCSPPLRPLNVANVLKDMKAALMFLYNLKDSAGQKRDYCHHDMNPWNIMLSPDDTEVLFNFESCKHVTASHSKGTAHGWGYGALWRMFLRGWPKCRSSCARHSRTASSAAAAAEPSLQQKTRYRGFAGPQYRGSQPLPKRPHRPT